MSIRNKILVGFAGILLLMIALTVVGILRVRTINDGLTQINDVNAVKQRYAINFRGSVHDRSIDIRDVVLIQDDGELLQSVLDNIDRLKAFYEESEAPMDEIFATSNSILAEEREALAEIKRVEEETEPVIERVIELRLAQEREAARRLLLESARPLFTEWLNVINVFIDLQERLNQEIAEQTRAVAEGFARLITIATAAALAVGAGLSIWAVRAINPLRDVGTALRDISEGDGDLTVTLNSSSDDEVGTVAAEFNGFVSSLRSIISTVRDSVERLAAATDGLVSNMDHTTSAVRSVNGGIDEVRSQIVEHQAPEVSEMSTTIEQIMGNVENLSSVIERQAQTIHDSTASVEELIANVASITENLQKSSERFDYLKEVADGGSERIREVNEMVASISEQSQGMLQANQVISNVAAQTNLLAMNAAIEAAHAGEAGKGFAVVADEIRKLAENSSTQSTSISRVLNELQRSIQEVVSKAGEAGSAFDSVQEAIETVVALQREIKGAMDEQTSGNQQVLASFEQINQLTSEVSNGSREMTAGSRSILEKMRGLVETTRTIETRVDEMGRSTGEIEQAIAGVERLTAQTREEVGTVRSGIERFRITREGQDASLS